MAKKGTDYNPLLLLFKMKKKAFVRLELIIIGRRYDLDDYFPTCS